MVLTLPWTIQHVAFKFFVVYVLLLSLIAFMMLGISRLVIFFFLQDREKVSEYECGFEPFDSATRQPFDIHFYMVGLLFLIFDVEISLLFPSSIYLFDGNWFSFWSVVFFLGILLVGLLYEWRLAIVDWPN